MTVQEYIDDNLPFYHMTDITNIDKILGSTLSNRSNRQGICVMRNDDNRVLHFIAQQIMRNDISISNKEFCLFKIIPLKHNLTAKDIDCDLTNEFTNPLHSYIKRKRLELVKEDICKYYTYTDMEDEIAFKEQLLSDGIIISLEYPNSSKWARHQQIIQLENECQ